MWHLHQRHPNPSHWKKLDPEHAKKKNKNRIRRRNLKTVRSLLSAQWARAHLLPPRKRQQQVWTRVVVAAVHLRRNLSDDRRRSWWWTWSVASMSTSNQSPRETCFRRILITTSATRSQCTSARACHVSPMKKSFYLVESTSSSLSRIPIPLCHSLSSAISPLKLVPLFPTLIITVTMVRVKKPPISAVKFVPSACKLVFFELWWFYVWFVVLIDLLGRGGQLIKFVRARAQMRVIGWKTRTVCELVWLPPQE